MNKKILLSLCLILLVAISVSAVSADESPDGIAPENNPGQSPDGIAPENNPGQSADATDPGDTDGIATDDASEVLTETYQPEGNSSDDVQAAVNKAVNAGDIVDLSVNSIYNFTNKTVTITNAGITIDGKGTTTIYGYGDGDGIFAIKAKNVTIRGIKFIDTNPKNEFHYNGTVAGWGISVNAADGGLIKDCEFTDFNSGIVVMGTVGFNIENNKFNGGYTTKLLNDPTVNKEEGSKSLNIYKQSSKIVVKNNTFDGPILDGVSIAQGSGSNIVIDNTFIGNCYSIYFGGASTKGTLIKNNTFINCGYFKEGNISWNGLPVISIQKASDSISIENNTFKAINNNILIAAEKGNEAHGSPTDIGDINITNNIITKLDDGVNVSSVTLFHILARASTFEIKSPINVTNNVLPEGVTGVSIWFNDNEIYSAGNVVLEDVLYDESTMFNSTIEVSDVNVTQGDVVNLKITLKNSDNVVLANKVLLVMLDGKTINAITDDEGVALVSIDTTTAGTKYASIVFLGEGAIYKGSIASAKITVNAKETPSTPVTPKKTVLTAKKATLKVKKAKKIKVTLKAEGKAVAGKTITIKVNKKTFKAKTNSKGVATIKVKVAKKGKFTATVKFAGDKAYKAATKTVKFTVKK